MIDRLLRQALPAELGIDGSRPTISASCKTGIFSLSDSDACHSCKQQRGDRQNCNEETLIVDAGTDTVSVLDLEQYISQLPARLNIHDRCDYLLLDDTERHRKIAFCDLTCSSPQWVEPNHGRYPDGKRAKAQAQMRSSMEMLMRSTQLTIFITTFVEKHCIFGWRDYHASNHHATPARGNLRANMAAFTATPSSMATRLSAPQVIMDHGFTFVQVKYPSAYVW